MHRFTIYSVLFAVAIGSTTALIFDSLFQQSSGCTVLVEVPLTPFDPYYKAEKFPTLEHKLNANQDRYNRELRQVWVDAPDPSICGYSFGGRCCLNGHFSPQYKWLVFRSGDRKKLANEQLWAEAQASRLPYYNVWADAPDRYCKRSTGLLDFLG